MLSRTDIIKKEMAFNEFRPKKIPGVVYDFVVAEIADCLHAVRHEGTIAPLGILFCRDEPSTEDGVNIVHMPQVPIEELRHLADGRRTFIVYSGSEDPRLAVFSVAIADDMRLLELSYLINGIVIKRDESGTVRIAQNGQIWLVENRNWECKNHLLEHMALVKQCLGSMPSSHSLPLYSLLKLAYYFLSSENVGTTLVWRLREPANATMEGLSETGLELMDLGLSINDGSVYSIIEHLVKYHDGAVIVDPEGSIEYLGAHLIYGSDAAVKVPQDKGTRHTSAKRFSFEHTETLVCVVSEDGPVSIYSDGYKITEMAAELGSKISARLKKSVPAKAEHISSSYVDITCRSCERYIRVEEVLILGWKGDEVVACPCCQSPNLFSSRCWSLSARPIKTWPGKISN